MARTKEMDVDEMLEAAKRLFFSRGIEKVTIRDIAVELGIGEATIYRYFRKKQYVVIACALKIWNEIEKSYISKILGENAYQVISSFYNIFIQVYQDHKEYYAFIAALDSFLMTEKLDEGILTPYEEIFVRMKKTFMNETVRGREDHSIKDSIDYDSFYNMSTHSILSLCKKLSLGEILESDQESDSVKEISMIIDVLLTYIRP